MKNDIQRPIDATRDSHHRIHQYLRLNEQELNAVAAMTKPNRFQRRAIATQQRKSTKKTGPHNANAPIVVGARRNR
jgi:hypothetical protein